MIRIAWAPCYAHELPENHRFPMAKYELLPEQLLYEGTISRDQLFAPSAMAEADILRTHDATYWQRLSEGELTGREQRQTGFPHSPELIAREICIMQGTLDGALSALESGLAFNIAGGTHHAFADRGEGFCLLNDIAIAANYLLTHGHCRQILVIDLDVHQGNGTAALFEDDSKVFTFSVHGEKNYPLRKEQSSLDIELPDGTGDRAYLDMLDKQLPCLFEQVKPDFVFFQSGVDVLENDKLGRLGMSLSGCRERDQRVFELCRHHEVPVQVSMGGGYSVRIADIIEAHANTFRLGMSLFAD